MPNHFDESCRRRIDALVRMEEALSLIDEDDECDLAANHLDLAIDRLRTTLESRDSSTLTSYANTDGIDPASNAAA